ncbi:hypothetical protein CC86DRAFT_381335 [Ophiobolus disseminans]|uniref:Uncharacterized protein n=1 Tax=Ophiobolus disseminans TaxID=1469910 RepID=A0A6A7A3L2_9PLEO|nr:hypothetical protein CC86DRAFT_381335 [Ophiobolus disseminans]
MHFHTPHLKKSEKRKASITSAHSEDAPVEKKATKPKKVKTTKPPKQKQLKALRRTQTPEDPHPQPPTPTLSRSASLDAVNTTSPPPPPPDDAMLAKSPKAPPHLARAAAHASGTL